MKQNSTYPIPNKNKIILNTTLPNNTKGLEAPLLLKKATPLRA